MGVHTSATTPPRSARSAASTTGSTASPLRTPSTAPSPGGRTTSCTPAGSAFNDTFAGTAWSIAQAAGLTAADFHPAPGFTGATPARPDFTASGAPLEFGYVRGTSARFPVLHAHGIDNWRVTSRR